MTNSIKLLIVLGILAHFLTGCASPAPVHPPYTYNGALSELHRAGNPNTRPAVPAYSDDLRTPNRVTSRVCSSMPIFNSYGEFVRYSVRCN